MSQTTTLGLKCTKFQGRLLDGNADICCVKVMVIHNPHFKLCKQCLCYPTSCRAIAFGLLLAQRNWFWVTKKLYPLVFHSTPVKQNYSPSPSWESEQVVSLVSTRSHKMVSWSKSTLITPSFTLSLTSTLVLFWGAGEPFQLNNQQKLQVFSLM